MRTLEWRQAARSDLLAIIDYIANDNPVAAQKLKDDIDAKVQKLADRALMCIAPVESPVRGKWSCGRITW